MPTPTYARNVLCGKEVDDMSETYAAPEIRELGALTALTLGSVQGGLVPFTKNVDPVPDAFSAPPENRFGSGCQVHIPNTPPVPCGPP